MRAWVNSATKSYSFTFGERHLQVATYTDNGEECTETQYYELAGEPDWDFILSCAM